MGNLLFIHMKKMSMALLAFASSLYYPGFLSSETFVIALWFPYLCSNFSIFFCSPLVCSKNQKYLFFSSKHLASFLSLRAFFKLCFHLYQSLSDSLKWESWASLSLTIPHCFQALLCPYEFCSSSIYLCKFPSFKEINFSYYHCMIRKSAVFHFVCRTSTLSCI